jgi:transcriptional regulator with XRE-family HTH domain
MRQNFWETLILKTMNKSKRADGHTSKVLGDLLGEISPKEHRRTESKMLLAAKIDEARIALGWSQTKFAEEMGKQPSEISKWLSGTHNFTSDTLWDIEEKLSINLISLHARETQPIKVQVCTIVVSGTAWAGRDRFFQPFPGRRTPSKSLRTFETLVYG